MSERAKSGLLVSGMVVFWAIYYAVSKYAVDATGSAFAAGLLLRAAALVFLTAQLALTGKLRAVFHQGRAALILLAIGTLGYLLDAFANLGYSAGTLGAGTALLKTDVLMANLATVVIYKKTLHLSDWLGTLIMLAGVYLVLDLRLGGGGLNWYDLFFIASALCVTANAFIIKAAQDKFAVDTDMIGYYNNLVVLLLFLVSALITGGVSAIGTAGGGAGFWGLVALGGLAQTMIYFFYYRCLKRFEVFIVKLYLLLMPILSSLIGVVFLNEAMSLRKAMGIAVILSGAALILLRDKLNRPAEQKIDTGK